MAFVIERAGLWLAERNAVEVIGLIMLIVVPGGVKFVEGIALVWNRFQRQV